MKIALISDLHGFLPYITKSDVDAVLIAGDICPDIIIPSQKHWIKRHFQPWLKLLPKTIYIPGNHDFYMYYHTNGHHGFEYLYGDITYKVYKFPYITSRSDCWAFNKSEKNIKLALTKDQNFDIILCHGPPFGICDNTLDGENAGSKAMRNLIQRVQPKLCVFGHIHEGYGAYKFGNTLCVNASICNRNRDYRMKYLVLDTNNMSIDIVPCEEWMND